MKKLREIIDKNSSGKKVLFFLILTNVIYGIMLAVTIPKTMVFSKDMKLLDMMPTGYNSEYIQSLFNTLGEAGRDTYLFYQIPVDMIYPLLFAICYCLIMAYFLKKLNKLDSPFFYLCLLPIVAATADYLENFGIIAMLNSYPKLSQLLMSATSIFSTVKSITTTLFFVSLVFILVMLAVQTVKRRITGNNRC